MGEIREHVVPITTDPQLPATNNLAERQTRPAVIHCKISAGNKTENGAKTIATLASMAASCAVSGSEVQVILFSDLFNSFFDTALTGIFVELAKSARATCLLLRGDRI